ncbi:hypothetical protein DPMN_025209 [Dreissena polymorpha]|uniref:Uncharacterized protein n=1 Tax=Dreissena polymorpha TaxID=45954 RepID=A0A9D4RCD1_DREPO|nr:hypothetical protein DPMN_025209 [Dreissena polymorpha]
MENNRREHVFCGKLCTLVRRRDVQHAIGAILVFTGLGLLITGAIFTAVSQADTVSSRLPSFRISGPVLLVLSLILIINGYSLCHLDDFKTIWLFFRRRRQLTYINNEDIDEMDNYSSVIVNGTFCAACFRMYVFICLRRRWNTGHPRVPSICSLSPFEVTVAPASDIIRSDQVRTESCASFSSLRNCKVAPN